MPTKPNIHQPDWNHYKLNKDRLDADAKALLESGHLQNLGYPEGVNIEIFAKGVVTILDKHPELAHQDFHGSGKPLSASEKRAKRRHEAEKVIEVELTEDQFKIIPEKDYIPPKPATYIKNGEEMPEGWQPIEVSTAA